MDLLPLKTVRNYHYFCRFELGKMSIYMYDILLALDLTQSVQAKLCIRMQQGGFLWKSNLNKITLYTKLDLIMIDFW